MQYSHGNTEQQGNEFTPDYSTCANGEMHVPIYLLAVDLELGRGGWQLRELREGDCEHAVLELRVRVCHVSCTR